MDLEFLIKSRDRNLLVLYLSVALSFIFVVTFHRRGYQDAWILDDILIPTLIFIFFSLIVETLVSDNKLTTVVGASFSAIFGLIPGLKYQIFYGCFDSVEHFGYIEGLMSLGYVPKTGFYAPYYSDVPGMHIFISSLSLVTGISTNEIFRFILPAIYGIIPITIFVITKGVFDKAVQRHIVIASSFPIVGLTSFAVSGTMFALILYFFFVAIFLHRSLTNKNKWEYALVLIILAFGLTISHGVTPLFLSSVWVGMVLALIFLKFIIKRFPGKSLIHDYIATSSLLIILVGTWWKLKAEFYFSGLSDILRRILAGKETGELIPTRLFDIPLLAQLKVLALFHLKDIIVVMMSLFGLSVFIWKFKRKELMEKMKVFYFQIIVLLCIISAIVFLQFSIGFGEIGYSRFLCYALVLSPFLAGLALWRIDKFLTSAFRNTTIENLAFASIGFVLFSICLIQVFAYQPMVPRANVLSKDLPEDVYILDFRGVNTIYQKEMISHAERYSSGNATIASDIVTRFQIYGFSDPSFSSRHIWYSPLEHPNLEWDLFLLHTDERAGPFNEKAEYHTKEKIGGIKEEGSIIYDNGLSIIVARVKPKTEVS